MVFGMPFCCAPAAVCVLVRWRLCLRACLFQSLDRKFAIEQPSIPEALGGRRGSRSDKNFNHVQTLSEHLEMI